MFGPGIKLWKAENGYVIQREFDKDIHEVSPRPYVVEDTGDSEISELVALRTIFHHLCEEFGVSNSRKRPHLQIKIVDGEERELA